MRTLLGDGSYAWPSGPWLRANMVTTVDGATQGPDGLSGSINNAADHEVFHLLRRTADVVLVGAGTARAEGYGPAAVPMVVVGHELPPGLVGDPSVRLVPGGDEEQLRTLVASLRAEGHDHVLCEGGPTLLGALLRAGLVDELCATITPLLAGGPGRRMVDGPLEPGVVPLALSSLVEVDGTLLTRWLVSRG